MTTISRATAHLAAPLRRLLTAATWLTIGVTIAAWRFLPAPWGGSYAGRLVAIGYPLFLACLMALVVLALVDGTRRVTKGLLIGLTVLWATGAYHVNDVTTAGWVSVPTPGEGWFIVGYAVLLLVLLTDGLTAPSLRTALDSLIVACSAACLAGTLAIGALVYDVGPSGGGSLIPMLYPVFDLTLLGTLLARTASRRWPRGRTTVLVAVGFVLLMLADTRLMLSMVGDRYPRDWAFDLTWAAGLSCVILGLTARRTAAVAATTEEVGEGGARAPAEPGPATPSTTASFVALGGALAVLVLNDTLVASPLLVVPAVLAVTAGQARLWLALREVRGASEAKRLSVTDDLTGLPNRRALMRHLGEALHRDEPLALMLLDLDGFKEINDGLGHASGDRLLQELAGRMRAAVPPDVFLARLGGDEFAVSCPGPAAADLHVTADQLLQALRCEADVDGVKVAVDASIGITMRQDDDRTGGDLLRRADVAMYQAKESRRGQVLYDPERDPFSRGRLELVDALRQGIDAGEIEMWYQPLVHAGTRDTLGMEALVRWRHPTEGLIAPGDFLPAARRAGLMLPLSQEVVRQVVADAELWAAAGLPTRVSLNVAPQELLGGVLVPELLSTVAASSLPSGCLTLEVTEDSFLTDPERARQVLQTLHDHGIDVAIDDYGTGFSSLGYLRDLPVQLLKIDRSFVAATRSDTRSRMIVTSTVTLAHALSMRVVGEGVEDAETALLLGDLGVDVLQGYHLARPMPRVEATAWLRHAVASSRPQATPTAP